MPLTHSLNVALVDCEGARISRFLGNRNCSMSPLATCREFTYRSPASRTYRLSLWKQGQACLRASTALGGSKLSADVSGLRGVQKAREPGSCSTSYPALRFAVRAAGNSRAFADDYGNSSRQETVTVGQLHTLFRPKSKGNDPKPRYWCAACGETIHNNGSGRARQHCSIECIEWDLNDARRSRDGVRLNRLYVLRGWWRKRMGGSV